MNGPNKSEIEKTGGCFDWLECGMVFAGALVVIGLLMESWPEIKLAINEHRFPNLTVTGGVIVTVGVLIEVVLGIFITQRANRAQSEAKERVARAEQATADANLARAKIEARLSSRKLTGAAKAELAELLKPYAGKHVDVTIFDHHIMEAWLFAASIAQEFRAAGWTALEFILDGPRLHGRAVTIAFAKDAPADEKATLSSIAHSFASVLNKCGISVTISEAFTMTEEAQFENAAPFRIQVGQINVVENPL